MADKPVEQSIRPKISPEVSAPQEELDLKLEKKETREQQTPEQEKQPEQTDKPKDQTEKPFMRRFRKPRPIVPLSAKDPVMVKIEKIMEDGLNDSYQRLSPVAKQEFKLKGEQTASEVGELLKSSHIKVKKILHLILDWLKMLPGVNSFFLEQEAKIKTDKIISLKDKS